MGTTKKLETPAFTIDDGAVTKDNTGSRTVFKFIAPSQRHLEGGFEVANVRAMLFDKEGRFIAKRGAESSRTVLANRAMWIHEIPNDQLTTATKFVYEIEYKFDIRRKLVAGELPTLPAESDGSDYFRWLNLDPRTLEDRTAKFEFALWARQSELAITYGHTEKFVSDSFRNEFELDLLDGDNNVVLTRNFSGSGYVRPFYDDTSIYGIDRRTIRSLKFFELRVRSEARGYTDLVVDNF